MEAHGGSEGSKPGTLKVEAIERGLARFRDVLRGRALKMSKVREAIARAALAYEGHFSVEELARALQDNGIHEAHLATVYRAIPLLVEAGLVQQALLSQGEGQRFEASFECARHDHLVCTSCGRVVEYESETLQALEREIARRYDFELEEQVLELRGCCRACRGRR